MSSSATDYHPAYGQAAAARRSRGFWPSIVRIAVAEVVLLVALAGVFIAYLNWSSEADWADFMAASKQSTSVPNGPIQAVKGHMSCDRSA